MITSGPVPPAQPTGPLLSDPPEPPKDPNYKWQWWLNTILVVLTILSVIANVIVSIGSAEFFGLTDIQWHYVLAINATLTALNAAFNRTPQVQNPPTTPRLQVEAQVRELRKNVD